MLGILLILQDAFKLVLDSARFLSFNILNVIGKFDLRHATIFSFSVFRVEVEELGMVLREIIELPII